MARLPGTVEIDAARTYGNGAGGVALRRDRRGARRAGLGAAEPRVAAAHLGGRRDRHRHPRLGRSATAAWPPPSPALELVTADGSTLRHSSAAMPTSTAWSSRSAPRRRHPGDPRHRADVRRAPGRLRAPAAGPRSPTHFDAITSQRLQRQPVHRLAAPTSTRCGSSRASTDAAATSCSAPPPATASCTRCPDATARRSPEQLGVPGPWWDRLPHFRLRVHPEQRRGAADRVPGPPRARPRGDRRRTRAGPAHRSRTCSSARSVRSRPTSCG